MNVRQDIDHLVPIATAAGVDRVQVEFRSGERVVGRIDAPALEGFSARDVMRLALDCVNLGELVRSSGLRTRFRFWWLSGLAVLRLGAAAIGARLAGHPAPPGGLRALAKAALSEGAMGATTGADERTVASLIAEGEAMAARTVPVDRRDAPLAVEPIARAPARPGEQTDRLPVLLYHRITEDGPARLARFRQTPAAFAEQMGWLRRNGYHAVTSTELLRQFASRRPFAGRPVMISFDDAYRDFHDTAWPILRDHGLTAEVFVVTDRVGGRADWDAAFGPPAPLMDWAELQALSAAGIRLGSHMASHSHMAKLSSREIVLEAARSRAALERALGTTCRSIAAPFGEGDDRFVRIAHACGYEMAFTTDPGHAALAADVLRLPRVEVIGGWSLEAFAAAVKDGSGAA
jgi:peptidoglycan/xylan/chitin deacetylase (PgdA/CDA1 family)